AIYNPNWTMRTSLPPEIMSEIFVLCGSESEGCLPRPVAQVSRRWRIIALSTPRMWNHLYLIWGLRRSSKGPTASSKLRNASLHALLDLQIERTARAPLSVTFGDMSDDVDVLGKLLQLSERWERCDIRLQIEQQHLLVEGGDWRFPRLRSMKLNHLVAVDTLGLGPLGTALPALERVIISYWVHPRLNLIGWGPLEMLTLCWCHTVDIIAALARCRKTRKVEIMHCLSPSQLPLPVSPSGIELELEAVTFVDHTASIAHDIFRTFDTPRLRSVTLKDFVVNMHLVRPIFAHLPPSLTHLHLCDIELPEPRLLALFRASSPQLPNVTELELTWSWDVHSDLFMNCMTLLPGTSGRANIFPRLRTLNITGGLSCREDALYLMLRSRVGVLRRAELFYAGRAFFFGSALDGLRAQGMEIDMRLGGPRKYDHVRKFDYLYSPDGDDVV
ncbi:unnamed protein product, partial [Mycena citricolor]